MLKFSNYIYIDSIFYFNLYEIYLFQILNLLVDNFNFWYFRENAKSPFP